MTLSADYYDWSQVSGIYLPRKSRLDRYRAYRNLISEAGWFVVIVSDFLTDNPDEPNPAQWRSGFIELFDEADERVRITAQALEAIGASRTAATVATIKPTSPFAILEEIGPYNAKNLANAEALMAERTQALAKQCEQRSQIESLLEQFSTDHKSDLDADRNRHGDPRQQPGYQRDRRLAELETMRVRLRKTAMQGHFAAELDEATAKLKKQLAKAGDDPKALKRLSSSRQSFRESLQSCQEIAPADRGPELTAALQAAAELMDAHAAFFNPPPTKDAALNAALAELGRFTADTDSDPCELKWESPAGFSGPWGDFSLSLTYPPGKTKVLRQLLTAVERLAARLPELAPGWYSDLIENFRSVYAGELDQDALAQFQVDPKGVITDASIRQHAGPGEIQLQHEDGEFTAQTWFPVAWDQEHGYPIEWDDDLVDELFAK